MRVGRNDKCPCGSMKKYKNCCWAKGIDFTSITHEDYIRTLTIHGKNEYFLYRLSEIFELDSREISIKSRDDLVIYLKRVLTNEKAKLVYKLIPEIWPDIDDYNRCMELESKNNSGLYIGNYLLDSIISLVNRYGLYEDSIFMIDPFSDHRIMVAKYNPLEHPELHMQDTLNNILIWIQFAPWIENGFVKFTRNPVDFDYDLMIKTNEASEKRHNECEEIRSIHENDTIPEEVKDFVMNSVMLHMPEQFLTENPQCLNYLKQKHITPDAVLEYIKKERRTSPYYIEGAANGLLLRMFSGANYEAGKYICSRVNSHILTDLKVRWLEMEYDRKSNGIQNCDWEVFSRHFQQLPLPYLNGLRTIDVMKLRNDGHLDSMRRFLKKLWLRSSPDSATEQHVIEQLSLELDDEVGKASNEWRNIDKNLAKWFIPNIPSIGMQLFPGTPWWATGVTAAVTGAAAVAESITKHKNFQKSYPAGLFLEKR